MLFANSVGLFAQGLGFDGSHGKSDPTPILVALLAVLAGGCVVAVIVLVVPLVLFNLTLADTIRQVHPAHRRIQPSQVWFDLIPVFNLVWALRIIFGVSASLKGEFGRRGEHRKGRRYGLVTGLTGLIALPVAGLAGWLAYSADSGSIAQSDFILLLLASGGVAVGSFVLYWVRMAQFGYRLKSNPPEPRPPQARRVSREDDVT